MALCIQTLHELHNYSNISQINIVAFQQRFPCHWSISMTHFRHGTSNISRCFVSTQQTFTIKLQHTSARYYSKYVYDTVTKVSIITY